MSHRVACWRNNAVHVYLWLLHWIICILCFVWLKSCLSHSKCLGARPTHSHAAIKKKRDRHIMAPENRNSTRCDIIFSFSIFHICKYVDACKSYTLHLKVKFPKQNCQWYRSIFTFEMKWMLIFFFFYKFSNQFLVEYFILYLEHVLGQGFLSSCTLTWELSLCSYPVGFVSNLCLRCLDTFCFPVRCGRADHTGSAHRRLRGSRWALSPWQPDGGQHHPGHRRRGRTPRENPEEVFYQNTQQDNKGRW